MKTPAILSVSMIAFSILSSCGTKSTSQTQGIGDNTALRLCNPGAFIGVNCGDGFYAPWPGPKLGRFRLASIPTRVEAATTAHLIDPAFANEIFDKPLTVTKAGGDFGSAQATTTKPTASKMNPSMRTDSIYLKAKAKTYLLTLTWTASTDPQGSKQVNPLLLTGATMRDKETTVDIFKLVDWRSTSAQN